MPNSRGKRPIERSVTTFVVGNGKPKRPPEVVEALLEEVVSRQEDASRMLVRIEETTNGIALRVTKIEERNDAHARMLQKVYDEQVDDRRVVSARLSSIMGLLQQIINQLPPCTCSSSFPPKVIT